MIKYSQFFLKLYLLLALLFITGHFQAISINNIGCRTINLSNVCIECSFRYFLSSSNICQPVNPNCKTYNSTSGACLTCYQGFSLSSGTCLTSTQSSNLDPNCNTFNGPLCILCSQDYYLSANGKCTAVSPSCKTYNSTNGQCTSCYTGYTVQNGMCVESQAAPPIANCYQTDSNTGLCLICSFGYYFNTQGVCVQQNPNCKTLNTASQLCLECYPGYVLSNINTCIESTPQTEDPNCQVFNGPQCVQCSQGAYFLLNGTCAVTNPLCKTFNSSNGDCLSCFQSYYLNESSCVQSNQTQLDVNCAQFEQGTCLKCSQGFIFLDSGICGIVDPNCQEFSNITGLCTSCYIGYALSNGTCIISSTNTSAIDPNCAAFMESNCIQCSKYFFIGTNGVCTAVDPLCNGYNTITGACLGCYLGYVLQGSTCIEDNKLTDPNCISWFEGLCVACASRMFMGNSGLCQNINANCNTYNLSNGQCTSCFSGYQVFNGQCQLAVSPSDCNKFKQDGSCGVCAQGSYMQNGFCISIDPQCLNFSLISLSCLSCQSEYSILNGVCLISTVGSQFQVQNCYAYSQQNKCIQCLDRYYLDSNTCKAVNLLCKTYDDYSGQCLSCDTTFTLVNGNCQT